MIGAAVPYLMVALLAVMTNTGVVPPVPLSETVKVGCAGSPVLMVRVEHRGPAPRGVKVTMNTQYEFAATLPPHASLPVKSPGFRPVIEAAVIGVYVNTDVPVLESATVWGALAEPTAMFPKT